MELILEYFSWCQGGRKSGIDPGDRVSSSASEEEEKEAVVGIKVGKNERPLYQRKKKEEKRPSELGQELGQMEKNESIYIGSFFTFQQLLKGNFVNVYSGQGGVGWNKIHTRPKPDSGF